MKSKWWTLALLVGAFSSKASHAQAAIYGEFSETELANLQNKNYLPGGTVGYLFDATTRRHLVISADIRGRFVYVSEQKLDTVAIGPRLAFPVSHGFALYGEFLVGFARYYSNGSNGDPVGSTTDATLQCNGGLSKKISPRWDATAEYSYSQFYAYGGEYNPKTLSMGAIFHFSKR
jgi:opacity protein-like surface antigen